MSGSVSARKTSTEVCGVVLRGWLIIRSSWSMRDLWSLRDGSRIGPQWLVVGVRVALISPPIEVKQDHGEDSYPDEDDEPAVPATAGVGRRVNRGDHYWLHIFCHAHAGPTSDETSALREAGTQGARSRDPRLMW